MGKVCGQEPNYCAIFFNDRLNHYARNQLPHYELDPNICSLSKGKHLRVSTK